MEDTKKFIETMFKLGGTNYSQVASKLKGKTGKSMSRQALFRMVKNGTITLDTVAEIAKILGLRIDVVKNGAYSDKMLSDVCGERVVRKIKGVRYDTNKMFSLYAYEEDGKIKDELCWEPVTDTQITVHYFGNEKRKYPWMEIIKGIKLP